MTLTTAPALIAFDMDGTLFDTTGVPLPSTISSIRAALAQDTTIVLASGRDAWALRHLASRSGLDPARLVFFGLNGTTIVDGATNRLIWSEQVAPDLLGPLMAHLRGFAVTPSISSGENLYVEDERGFNVEVEAGHNFQRVVALDKLEEVPVPARKVLVSAPRHVLAADHLAIAAPFIADLDFAFSAPTHFEGTPKGVNKGAALRHYCQINGIDLADTVAFGDNENDLEMLRAAGLGVAMGNGLASVKEAADVVTADNNSDGISLILGARFGLA